MKAHEQPLSPGASASGGCQPGLRRTSAPRCHSEAGRSLRIEPNVKAAWNTLGTHLRRCGRRRKEHQCRIFRSASPIGGCGGMEVACVPIHRADAISPSHLLLPAGHQDQTRPMSTASGTERCFYAIWATIKLRSTACSTFSNCSRTTHPGSSGARTYACQHWRLCSGNRGLGALEKV